MVSVDDIGDPKKSCGNCVTSMLTSNHVSRSSASQPANQATKAIASQICRANVLQLLYLYLLTEG